MNNRLENIARQYYNDLIQLHDSNNRTCRELSRKAKQIGEEEFVREYPLSILGVVSLRTFWEMCRDVGITKSPFFSEYRDMNDFEKRLYDMVTSIMNMGEDSLYTEDDIKRLFREYKICA